MAKELKTEWIICSDNTDIDELVADLEHYCVGKARFINGDFDSESSMKMNTKIAFDVFVDTDMDEFWDLIDGVIDDECEE